MPQIPRISHLLGAIGLLEHALMLLLYEFLRAAHAKAADLLLSEN